MRRTSPPGAADRSSRRGAISPSDTSTARRRSWTNSRRRAPTTCQALEYALLDARCAHRHEATISSTKATLVLELGRSAGFVRTLADEGPAFAAALADALRHQPADAYSDQLAPVLEQRDRRRTRANVVLFGGVALSERELTVLKYLATRLTTREIAAELYVSMNTFAPTPRASTASSASTPEPPPRTPHAPPGSSETNFDVQSLTQVMPRPVRRHLSTPQT